MVLAVGARRTRGELDTAARAGVVLPRRIVGITRKVPDKGALSKKTGGLTTYTLCYTATTMLNIPLTL